MKYYGDYKKNTIIHLSFNTVNQNNICSTITNSGAGVLDNDTSNLINGTGISFSGNIQGLTGIHIVGLDLSHSGFINGNTYSLYLTSGIVDTINVANRIIGSFSVGKDLHPIIPGNNISANNSGIINTNTVLWNSGTVSSNIVGIPIVDLAYVTGATVGTTGTIDANIVAISGVQQTAWDLKSTIDTVESGYGLQSALRLMLSSLAGKVSGADTTSVYIRDVNNRINRIIATCDASGNRTSITYDLSS